MLLEGTSYFNATDRTNIFNSMRADPLLTATHFERRFKALFQHVINGPDLPLGEVTDHFIRVEFQNRGSPHYHMFFWIANVTRTVTTESIPELTTYIDRVICTNIPSESIDPKLHNFVTSLQTHSHSRYCTSMPRQSVDLNSLDQHAIKHKYMHITTSFTERAASMKPVVIVLLNS